MGSRFLCLLTLILALGFACPAQVLSLGKVQDPGARQLQQKYIAQLQQVSTDFSALHFPYPFYFSQTLDIDEARQKQLPQGSLHFERFNGRMVLEITGNYYASYSTAVLTPNQRARKTFQDVVLPLLKTASARMDRTVPFDAYAFEIAHHVRSKVLKVDTEGPENLTVILPRAMAEKIVNAKDVEGQQSALLESGVYLNSEPLTLWLTGDDAPADVKEHYRARFTPETSPKAPQTSEPSDPGTLVNPNLIPDSELETRIRNYAKSPHEVSPEQLAKLNTAYQPTVQKLTDDLKPQAHFVDYAPPVFIAFKDGAYLQLTMTTELDLPQGSSQYRIAALAFENHIAHLLRPVSKYFHDKPQFDGVDFSTTAKQPGQPGSESVEFVVPLGALLAYEKYDLTGQELVNRSIVLINGERVSLDLQRAESEPSATLH